MLEYEVIAKKRLNDLHRQAESHRLADLASSDERTGRNGVRGIVVRIGRTFMAAYRIIVRAPETLHGISFEHSDSGVQGTKAG